MKMNRGGFFCFVFVLAFLSAEVTFMQGSSAENQEMLEAKIIAFDLEKTSFTRTLMENSVDSVLRESLRQGLVQNLGPEEIKDLANRNLELLFQRMETAYGQENLKFYPKEIGREFLNSNSVVLVTKLGEKTIEAEYCFTGGIMKENRVFAEIKGKEAKQEFQIPAGYTIKATVIG